VWLCLGVGGGVLVPSKSPPPFGGGGGVLVPSTIHCDHLIEGTTSPQPDRCGVTLGKDVGQNCLKHFHHESI
jgi:hypothetical protein